QATLTRRKRVGEDCAGVGHEHCAADAMHDPRADQPPGGGSVRSGHGSPGTPVCAAITGMTAPSAPAPRPAIVMCSGTEDTLRMTTAPPSTHPAVRMQRNRTGITTPMGDFSEFRGTKARTLSGGAFRYLHGIYRAIELASRNGGQNGRLAEVPVGSGAR